MWVRAIDGDTWKLTDEMFRKERMSLIKNHITTGQLKNGQQFWLANKDKWSQKTVPTIKKVSERNGSNAISWHQESNLQKPKIQIGDQSVGQRKKMDLAIKNNSYEKALSDVLPKKWYNTPSNRFKYHNITPQQRMRLQSLAGSMDYYTGVAQRHHKTYGDTAPTRIQEEFRSLPGWQQDYVESLIRKTYK